MNSTWDYRLVRYSPDSIVMREVHYTDKGNPLYFSIPEIEGVDVSEVVERYQLMANAFTQPVIDFRLITDSVIDFSQVSNKALDRLSELDEELGLT